jgi:hypothetical protein
MPKPGGSDLVYQRFGCSEAVPPVRLERTLDGF